MRKGFTVIELLVVVGIIALLLSIIIPAISHTSNLGSPKYTPVPITPQPQVQPYHSPTFTPETIQSQPLEQTASAAKTACTCGCACCK